MTALRPSMAALSRSMLRSGMSKQVPRASTILPLRPPVLGQLRGVRTSPFGRGNNNNGSSSGLGAGGSGSQAVGAQTAPVPSFSFPHEAPSADAPRSFSAPGGWTRALTSLGIIGGTALAANAFLNRETRDGPMDAFSREYLNSTFKYLAGGLTMTAGAAVALHRIGFSYRLMSANPWLVLGLGLATSIGGMIGAQTLEPGSPGKLLSWAVFNASQAAVLSPLLFFSPALLARAGLYTAGIVGSICYVGATAKDGQYLWMGGPLLAGVTVVALSSLAPMILPATAFRTLVATEAISLYGGLAVFSGFVLWDTQKILAHAKAAQAGYVRADPLRESIGLELDVINIFVRMVQILAMQQNGGKKK
ncbi:hypothetical protein BDZ90DRAFT_52156 [Jaminaea rosea]|uniref:Bax inhibitor family protein n=1 Tax=Jaminaea rosea TaxID=1569628 RepID=A0A316UM77_9BASI|nr:hypothetical protein BDZ90DRAFT_52156 [Jaminaea rosea]PWN26320.1 hypothetical protein BDZ90DRAFT_52156 [Jaminaea rosea]